MFEEDTQNFTIDSILQKLKAPPAKSPGTKLSFQNSEREAESSLQKNLKTDASLLSQPVAAKPNLLMGKKFIVFQKKFWWTVIGLVIVIGISFIGIKAVSLGQKVFQGKSPLSFIASFGKLLLSDDRQVLGEKAGAVNVLLLGIGGEGHEGALLTDTIMLASIRPPHDKKQEGEISLLSIPRDLIAKLPEGLEWRKINSAYAYGELKQAGLGAAWITDVMEDLTGEKIPYYVIVDFTGFKQAIDDLGGLDIYIERSFTDAYYPDWRKGYLPLIKFEQGLEHMNGERALQFARSRHGTNNEGSDFARLRRQQKILAATKEKLAKLRISSLATITRLLENFADHVKTNLEPWEIKKIYELTRDITSENIISLSLDPATGLVCNEIVAETGAYVLTYCPSKTKADIRAFVAERFDLGHLVKESPKIQVQNSTKIAGLAQRAEFALKKYNFETSSQNFPEKQEYPITTIYDLTAGAKPRTLKYLESQLAAYVAASFYPFPERLSEPKPDFVVVLGTDAPTKIQQLLNKNAARKTVKEPAVSDNVLR